jgi:NAD(P) transhydrogenase subunit beta
MVPGDSAVGGAVALVAWVEFREGGGYAGHPVYFVVASLFAVIVGSVSFWGSLIAFGKLQEILPSHPIGLGRAQSALNGVLLLAAVVLAVFIGVGGTSELLIVGIIVIAAVLGVMVVLPIGGADMPVVISLPTRSPGSRPPPPGWR